MCPGRIGAQTVKAELSYDAIVQVACVVCCYVCTCETSHRAVVKGNHAPELMMIVRNGQAGRGGAPPKA